jgi:trimeric autotransporter adhesin
MASATSNRLLCSLLVILLTAGVVSCGSSGKTPSSIAVTSPSDLSGDIAKGAQLQMQAIVTFSDGSTQNVTSAAAWATSQAAVAAVTSGGLVTGTAAGTSDITADYTSNSRTVSSGEVVTVE